MTPDGLDCRPPKPFRTIAHHVVELFKGRLNDATEVGFHCHCGHKGGVQFTEYQAMTALPSTVPDNICDLVIAAWRAHTKDLDGVHPNAEDQIRDFFTRQLEQPGGPTMTAPRYPLTAIPLNTPKPKSIAISAYVDEALRGILVDYAEKLSVKVDPMGGAEWDVAANTNLPWYGYASENVATATAMREYLARLLYGDEGVDATVEQNTTTVHVNFAQINGELDEIVSKLKQEEAEAQHPPLELTNTPPTPPLAISTETRNSFADDPELTTKQAPSSDRPTRIILRSYAADDKPRIERLLGLARQLQIPVQLAGSWSCTAFPKGEEAHPALDVVFPEVLVHPRDVLILTFPNGEHIGDNEGSNLSKIENQLLWETREQDQRFITSLIELLGLHAEASRADIAAAVEAKGLSQPTAGHPGWMECNAMDDRIRDILGAVYGEETDEAARRFAEEREKERAELVKKLEQPNAHEQDRLRRLVTSEDLDAQVRRILVATYEEKTDEAAKRVMSAATEWRTSILTALGLPPETSIDQVVETIEEHGETNAVTSHHLTECHRQRTRYEECDAQVRDILGAAKGEESVDAAKRVVVDLAEWKRGQESWKNDATTQRQETAENQRKLLDILNAGTVYPDWKHCLDYAEARMAKARKFEGDVNEALGIHLEQSPHSALQRAKWLKEQAKYQTEELAKALGYKSDDFSALLEQVQRVIREHQTLLGERIESNAKIDQLCASLSRERDRLCRHAESAQNNNAVEQLNAIHVRILHILGPDASTAGIFDSVEKVVKDRDSLGEKLDIVHRDLAKRLGLPKAAGWSDIMDAVDIVVGDSRNPVEIRANNKELGAKLAREYDRNLHLRAALDTAEKDRDALKERLETAVTAERQTVAQRIDLALTGSANCTDLESMLRAVEHVKSALSDAEAARRNLIAVLSLNEAAGWGTIASFVAGKRDGLKDCLRRLSLHQSLIGR